MNRHIKRGSFRVLLFTFFRVLLGGFFIYASIDKIAFPGEFVKVIEDYGILPSFFVKPFSIIIPWLELIFGVFLIVGFLIRESTVILSTLLIIFIIGVGIRSAKGPIEDCGCFNETSILATSNIAVIILRDFLFLGLGILILFFNKLKRYRSFGEQYPKK